MKKQLLAVIFLVGFLTGCSRCILVRSEYYDVTGRVLASKDDNREVFLLPTRPDKPYDEIGVVKVMARWEASREAVNKEIKRRAKDAGADAVTDIEYGEDKGNTLPLCGKIGTTKKNKSAKGKAIVFRAVAEKEKVPLEKENR